MPPTSTSPPPAAMAACAGSLSRRHADTQIAAHALALGVTLVTDNLREFQRVAGLKLANWAD